MEPFDDPVLGRFVFDPSSNMWKGELRTPEDRALELLLDCDREDISPTDAATCLWLCQNERAIRYQLAEQMVALARDWREGRNADEPVITTASFAERIALRCASVDGNGFCLDYSDDGMFGEHTITVCFNAAREMGQPGLAG